MGGNGRPWPPIASFLVEVANQERAIDGNVDITLLIKGIFFIDVTIFLDIEMLVFSKDFFRPSNDGIFLRTMNKRADGLSICGSLGQ